MAEANTGDHDEFAERERQAEEALEEDERKAAEEKQRKEAEEQEQAELAASKKKKDEKMSSMGLFNFYKHHAAEPDCPHIMKKYVIFKRAVMELFNVSPAPTNINNATAAAGIMNSKEPQPPKMDTNGYPRPTGSVPAHYTSYDLRVAFDTASWVGHRESAREIRNLLIKLVEVWMRDAHSKSAVIALTNITCSMAENAHNSHEAIRDGIVNIMVEIGSYNKSAILAAAKKKIRAPNNFRESIEVRNLDQKSVALLAFVCHKRPREEE